MNPALDVRSLTVRYGGLVAIHDVTLGVDAGEICGLIGPNGAGKSTFIDAISGFVDSTGEVFLDGVEVTGESPHRVAARGMHRTFQSLELFDDLSVAQNLVVAATRPKWWSPLRDAVWPRGSGADAAAAVRDAAERTGVAHLLDEVPEELSNGERHRVALARVLVGSPRLLLLDEPAAGLDPDETAELSRLLRSVADSGVGILLVDHDMALVMTLCDRIHVLERGSLLASGTPTEIREDRLVIAAYLGNELDAEESS